MKDFYMTLEDKHVPLSRLTAEERRFLGEMHALVKRGISFLDFDNKYMDPGSLVYRHAKRLKRPVQETPLYQICDDLGRRLAVRQGYMVREEIVGSGPGYGEERKELTTGLAAKLAGCTHEAIRKAIRTGRLRARRVGRLSLIWEEDAKAFAEQRQAAQRK
ncbi:MAG: excisionase family DNA-binding protein [Elusimicrobiota bacterium]